MRKVGLPFGAQVEFGFVETLVRRDVGCGMPRRGTCRVCGCTELVSCVGEDGGPSGWMDGKKTLCTACAGKAGA